MAMLDGIISSTVMYGFKSWTFNINDKKRVGMLEIKCLRVISGAR